VADTTGASSGQGAAARALQLSLGQTWFWYLFAGITYLAASIWQKGLLNWIIGPLWLVAVVWIGPALVNRVRKRHRP
jgi:hypothetical protein